MVNSILDPPGTVAGATDDSGSPMEPQLGGVGPFAQSKYQGSAPPLPGQHPHYPIPDPVTGALVIDPDILLIAQKFNLAINFTYSSVSDLNAEYGYGRSASVRAYIASSTANVRVTLVRGDLTAFCFDAQSPVGGITGFSSVSRGFTSPSLTFDGTAFTEVMNDGYQLKYQAQGSPVDDAVNCQLVRVTDPTGVAQTYTYGSGVEVTLLKTITVPGGNKVTFVYAPGTGTSLLSSIQDWAGRLTTFQYDANNNLTTMITPIGCATGYGYTTVGSVSLIDSIQDPRGYVTSYEYNSLRQVTTMVAGAATWTWEGTSSHDTVMTSPTGALTTYHYDLGLITAIDRPEGYTTSYSYVNAQKVQEQIPAGTISSVTYDPVTWLPTATDDALGNRMTMLYDSYGNLTTQIDANGFVWTYVYSGSASSRLRTQAIDPLGRVTSYGYDATGLLVSQTDGRGLVTTYNYDAYGNVASMVSSDGGVTTYQYDNLNRRTVMIDPLGRVSTVAYDAADHVVSTIDPTGAISTFIYDGCLLVATVDPLGNRTSFTYGRFSKRTSVTDALGNVTTTNYDNMGYPVSMQDALGNVTTTVYNAAKQKIADLDALGFATSYVYDTSGRLSSVEDANNNVSTTQYNARGNVTTSINALGLATTFVYDNIGRKTASTDELGRTNTTVYDSAGQLSATVDPLGHRTTMQYDAAGNRTTTIDANGHISTSVYGTNSNRLGASVDANGFRTSFLYDLAGQQTTLTDARSNSTTFAYDGAGRLTVQTNPMSQSTTYGYDAAGRNTTVIDALGNVKTVTYDAVGRVVSMLYANGTRVTQAYDPVGRRTTMMDSGGTTTFGYSARGELLRQSLPGGYLLTMAYDAVGNRTTLIDPDGGIATFVYDTLNRMSSTQAPGGSRTTFQYDAASQRTTMADASGGTRKYAYDAAGRLTTQIDLNSSAAPIMTIVDTYDPVGNRTARNTNGAPVTWQYDAGYRLTTQTQAGANATFVYDAAGNTLLKWQQSVSPMTFAYDAANRITTLLQAAALTTYSYDATGNLTGELSALSATTNTYDNENRLIVQAVNPSAVTALVNPGFETPSLGSGTYAFEYNPTGSGVGWTFSGSSPNGSGVSGNDSGFTAGNPDAPEGSQVAFLQETGTISQAITLACAGTLTVSFYAAQRASGATPPAPEPNEQEFTVSVGGTVVGTFTPSSTDYASFTTDAIFLIAGTYDVAFTGLNPLGGDNTAFIDDVTLSFTPTAYFDAVGDFTVDTAGVSDNGLWQYGYLPDFSSPATSFVQDTILTLTWAGITGFSGHYAGSGTGIVLGNLTSPPETIVQSTAHCPVGQLVTSPGPSGQYGAIQFLSPGEGTYDVIGLFQGDDVDNTTTDVHVLKISGGASTSLFSGYVDGYYGGDADEPTGPTPVVDFALYGVALLADDALMIAVGDGGNGYYNDTTGLNVRVTPTAVYGSQVSTYTYDGDSLRRSAQEPGAAGPTTFIWDGTDYLGEY